MRDFAGWDTFAGRLRFLRVRLSLSPRELEDFLRVLYYALFRPGVLQACFQRNAHFLPPYLYIFSILSSVLRDPAPLSALNLMAGDACIPGLNGDPGDLLEQMVHVACESRKQQLTHGGNAGDYVDPHSVLAALRARYAEHPWGALSEPQRSDWSRAAGSLFNFLGDVHVPEGVVPREGGASASGERVPYRSRQGASLARTRPVVAAGVLESDDVEVGRAHHECMGLPTPLGRRPLPPGRGPKPHPSDARSRSYRHEAILASSLVAGETPDLLCSLLEEEPSELVQERVDLLQSLASVEGDIPTTSVDYSSAKAEGDSVSPSSFSPRMPDGLPFRPERPVGLGSQQDLPVGQQAENAIPISATPVAPSPRSSAQRERYHQLLAEREAIAERRRALAERARRAEEVIKRAEETQQQCIALASRATAPPTKEGFELVEALGGDSRLYASYAEYMTRRLSDLLTAFASLYAMQRISQAGVLNQASTPNRSSAVYLKDSTAQQSVKTIVKPHLALSASSGTGNLTGDGRRVGFELKGQQGTVICTIFFRKGKPCVDSSLPIRCGKDPYPVEETGAPDITRTHSDRCDQQHGGGTTRDGGGGYASLPFPIQEIGDQDTIVDRRDGGDQQRAEAEANPLFPAGHALMSAALFTDTLSSLTGEGLESSTNDSESEHTSGSSFDSDLDSALGSGSDAEFGPSSHASGQCHTRAFFP